MSSTSTMAAVPAQKENSDITTYARKLSLSLYISNSSSPGIRDTRLVIQKAASELVMYAILICDLRSFRTRSSR
ncbi:hypothetical protein QJS10_CPB11g00954 [Acorus calamus]|uniref:Uncharacterized protein n=1 Tax=Acorus calamus TaxID=4465 RepID=A0AAV9DU88_ACOCL|nr:hypothetical protein QJS10_CPB11g00954 [Acorus calamus]